MSRLLHVRGEERDMRQAEDPGTLLLGGGDRGKKEEGNGYLHRRISCADRLRIGRLQLRNAPVLYKGLNSMDSQYISALMRRMFSLPASTFSGDNLKMPSPSKLSVNNTLLRS